MTDSAARERSAIVLGAGLRTPWARAGGRFAREDAGHLGAQVARELLARSGVDPGALDEVIVGCVGPSHDQANVGRVVALRAGVPARVPARTVARNCASGMEAVACAMAEIAAGRGDLYLCVGVEVMSAYPLLYGPQMTDLFTRLSRSKTLAQRLATLARFRPRFLAPRVALMEGLVDPVSGMIMGKTAELLAREFGISRAEADAFACESHRRAKAARAAGHFQREIAPVLPLGTSTGGKTLADDDSIRGDQSVEALAKLKPYFEKPDGEVTVGNSCGITDGAAALLVTTAERARELGLTPLASIRGAAWAGCDPARMGLGPVFATHKALAAAGCTLADLGVVEINEAFAAQVLACHKAFASDTFAREQLGREHALGELDPEKTNRQGGAIALGHPLGATGTRLLLTVAHQMAACDAELGLATLCIGGGQGGAFVLERSAA